MELNINSPAYFSEHYGVDDDVYRFCQKAHLYFKDKEYSNILHTIGIMTVVAPEELYESGAWKENTRFISDRSVVSVTIRMDFQKYYSADSGEKIQLMKDTILKAVKKVKSKGKFDYSAFADELEMFSCMEDFKSW